MKTKKEQAIQSFQFTAEDMPLTAMSNLYDQAYADAIDDVEEKLKTIERYDCGEDTTDEYVEAYMFSNETGVWVRIEEVKKRLAELKA